MCKTHTLNCIVVQVWNHPMYVFKDAGDVTLEGNGVEYPKHVLQVMRMKYFH